MSVFLMTLLIALIVSSIGFKKYVWFISIGYGLSIAAIGAFLPLYFGAEDGMLPVMASILLILYGCRLSGFLIYRELRSSSYNRKMQKEIKDGKDMPFAGKCGIWISAALLYACEAAPISFRFENGSDTYGWLIAGMIIMVCGLVLETAADLQKNAAKKINPKRFVDTGLYKIVRCPNYLGEMTFWTGVFISGIGSNIGVWQWIAAVVGYVGIIYVMFGGARRLEMRQNRTYGDDPEYQAYVKKTPIMIPLIPLYSVEKYKWLVA